MNNTDEELEVADAYYIVLWAGTPHPEISKGKRHEAIDWRRRGGSVMVGDKL